MKQERKNAITVIPSLALPLPDFLHQQHKRRVDQSY